VIAQLVPRKAHIKNFKEDDPRLQGVQNVLLKKLNKEYNKIIKRNRNRLTNPIQFVPKIDKLADRYVVIPKEELVKPHFGRTAWSFAPEGEDEPPQIEIVQTAIQVTVTMN
jgi:hypothetical protein